MLYILHQGHQCLDLLGELLELFKGDSQSSHGPVSPPFKGIVDGVAKVKDISMGANMIILFPLAMMRTKGEVKLKVNSNPQ